MIFPCFYIDISRLLSRAGNAVPTGIDRVEYEYAAYLLANHMDRTEFVAYHPLFGIRPLNMAQAAHFLSLTSALWNGEHAAGTRLKWLARSMLYMPHISRQQRALPPSCPGVYLLLSHHHLMKMAAIRKFLDQTGARMVAMVHDIIPMQFPEYNRPGEADRHRRRIASVARFSSGVIVPSTPVERALQPFLPAHLHIQTVAHGLHLWGADACGLSGIEIPTQPYFMCIGTIEPRKNHLLLLNVWRELTEKYGEKTPQLLIVGRRGWENENIIDMLERCPALRHSVKEYNTLNDKQVTLLLRGSKALLFPSFAEGFGLPLVEALSLDVPVLCSDLPVFQEIAGNAARYLNPLDGKGWTSAVEALAFRSGSSSSNRPHPSALPWPAQVRQGLEFANRCANQPLTS